MQCQGELIYFYLKNLWGDKFGTRSELRNSDLINTYVRRKMKLENLNDLFLTELKDVYSAETQIIAALPKMIDAASHEELKAALEHHLKETKDQLEQLKEVLSSLKKRAGGETCEGMKGLLKEGKEMIKHEGDPDAIDAGIIASCQKVEHYEIASYGCLVTYAKMLV